MNSAITERPASGRIPLFPIFALLTGAGFLYFIFLATGAHPEKAWLVYLVNYLLFTGLATGAMLFSTMMHFTQAKWSRSLSGIAESFSFFFPVSFVLFLLLFLGQDHLFTWLREDLHGKEVWLNVPFLFSRNLVGFLILYALGFGYLYHSLWFRLDRNGRGTFLKRILLKRWNSSAADPEIMKRRMTFLAGWFMFAFTLVLALVGFDLVMSMDPHWYSTLFGAYTFIKAVYSGFGALIILAAFLHLSSAQSFRLSAKQFRDAGALFFGFSLVWGDFFYAQFLVIWYGNIPEETTYIIERTMTQPWTLFAWTIFIVCFIMPFILLLSGKLKEYPKFMTVICSLVLIGFWLEHFLLLAPNYLHSVDTFPLGLNEVIISVSFLGLLVLSLIVYFRQFPELLNSETGEAA